MNCERKNVDATRETNFWRNHELQTKTIENMEILSSRKLTSRVVPKYGTKTVFPTRGGKQSNAMGRALIFKATTRV